MAEMTHTPTVRIESSKVADDKNLYELHRQALARAYAFLLNLPRPNEEEPASTDAPKRVGVERVQEVGNER